MYLTHTWDKLLWKNVLIFIYFFYRAVDEDVMDKDQILLQKEAEVGTQVYQQSK